MTNRLYSILFAIIGFTSNAQNLDSTKVSKSVDKLAYKQFIAPVALVSSGALLLNSKLNSDIQSSTNNFFGKNFQTSIDDLFPLAPIAQIYLGRTLQLKPRNNFRQQTINIIVANGITGTVIYALKYGTQRERPSKEDNLSFPSGHTGIAFTNASLLFYEYKDSNLWYASSGFLFATATGILRIANNDHYASDVLAGAGLGIASGLIVSYLNPLKSMSFGKKKKTTAFLYPQIGNQIGMGALIQMN